MLRMFTLQMMLVSINECNKQLLQAATSPVKPEIKSGGKVLARALLKSLTVPMYRETINESLAAAESLLQYFVAIQHESDTKNS